MNLHIANHLNIINNDNNNIYIIMNNNNNNPRRFDREARELCWSNVYSINKSYY